MILTTDLVNDVQQMLTQLAASSSVLSSQVATDKIYEVFILGCLAKALRSIGATLQVMDSHGLPASDLVFRLKPGKIYHPSSAPGFILVSHNGKSYEIQNGLRVLGRSEVLHELDVCLIDHSEAHDCRINNREPKGSKVRFLAECKFYGSSLDLRLGREYLGLSTEFSMRVKTIVSNVGSASVRRLVTKHRGTVNFDISTPNSRNVDRFVQWLANELMQIL